MNRKFISVASAFALLANSLVVVAQNPVPDKARTEKQDVIINREFKVITDETGTGERTMFFSQATPAGAVPGLSVGGGNFSFGAAAPTQLRMDAKVVKGKPYSAEIVSEHIQTLGDGNRITRKSNASVARDSEGRTRQESILQAYGPFAEAMKDLPKHISIYDPVAGTTFMLNPKEKTAIKLPQFNIRVDNFMSGSAKDATIRETKITASSPSETVTISSTPTIQRVSGGVLTAHAINKVQPQYPAVAKAAGAQGAVQVRVVVNEKGEVITEDVVGGHPLLKDAAAEAAHQWKFQPTEMSGQPVKVQGILTFNFTLNDSPNALEKTTTGRKAGGVAAAQCLDCVLDIRKTEGLPEAQDIQLFFNSESKYQKKSEPLGKQNLEGVECEGTRTVMTIPAGELGNDNPINVITETWTSTDLQVTVLRKFNDPRFGEDIYRLTNISRSEPDKELFKVPADFKIIEEGPHMMPGWMMRTMQLSEPSEEGTIKIRPAKRIEERATKEQ